jgi:hypothetical protein
MAIGGAVVPGRSVLAPPPGRVQLTVSPLVLQIQPLPWAEVAVSPAGTL